MLSIRVKPLSWKSMASFIHSVFCQFWYAKNNTCRHILITGYYQLITWSISMVTVFPADRWPSCTEPMWATYGCNFCTSVTLKIPVWNENSFFQIRRINLLSIILLKWKITGYETAASQNIQLFLEYQCGLPNIAYGWVETFMAQIYFRKISISLYSCDVNVLVKSL